MFMSKSGKFKKSFNKNSHLKLCVVFVSFGNHSI